MKKAKKEKEIALKKTKNILTFADNDLMDILQDEWIKNFKFSNPRELVRGKKWESYNYKNKKR